MPYSYRPLHPPPDALLTQKVCRAQGNRVSEHVTLFLHTLIEAQGFWRYIALILRGLDMSPIQVYRSFTLRKYYLYDGIP